MTMKTVLFSTYDIRGGAARAAYRLHKGLRQCGTKCRMLVKYKDTSDEAVDCVVADKKIPEAELFLNHAIQKHYIDLNRTAISNTLFSLPYYGYDLSTHPSVQDADIINLHWIAHFQSPLTLHKLLQLGKPIVWTLHDQWAFTGGCHYSSGCLKYREDCVECPQLAEDPFRLSEAIFKDRLELINSDNLTIVTPGNWLADCARQSRLFKKVRIKVIPYSLETDIFKPIPKKEAKNRLKINEDTLTLLFCADVIDEKRKGFHKLISALQHCLNDNEFKNLVKKNKIRLLCLGTMENDLNAVDIPVYPVGHLNTDEEISMVYSAADIFLLPSLEDNLPNTVLEAMSCGVPVVAFDVGGVPDMIEDGVTGRLAPAGDERCLSEMILSLIFNAELRETMSRACRKVAVNRYALDTQAKNYLNLFNELKIKNSADLSRKSIETIKISELSSVHPPCDSLDFRKSPNFNLIYDQILLKALTKFTPLLQEKYQKCEADRAARLEALDICEADRTARLEALEKCEKDYQRRLDACEADRTARLEALKKCEKDYQQRLDLCEADRAARSEAIKATYEKYQGLLDICEEDRAARLEAIHSCYEKLEKHLAKNAEQQEEINALKQQLSQSKVKVDENENTILALKENINKIEADKNKEIEEIEEQIRNVYDSSNYKIGKSILKPLSMIKKLTNKYRG
ncbi:glycosyltransferase [Desulfococcaceae bacterium HSG9]|nr:glycosyltransferase [Desulfococcaceae bacterium HSG9]